MRRSMVDRVYQQRHLNTHRHSVRSEGVSLMRWCPIKLYAECCHRASFDTPKYLSICQLDICQLDATRLGPLLASGVCVKVSVKVRIWVSVRGILSFSRSTAFLGYVRALKTPVTVAGGQPRHDINSHLGSVPLLVVYGSSRIIKVKIKVVKDCTNFVNWLSE